MSYKTELQNNNIDLQSILNTVNSLPEGSGGSSKNTINVTINAASASVYYFDADGTACEVSMGNNVSVDVLYGVVTYYAYRTIQAVLSGTYVEHTNATSARAGTVCFLEDGGSIELIDAPV